MLPEVAGGYGGIQGDTPSPTLQQVLQSAYEWQGGFLRPTKMLDPRDLIEPGMSPGDSLLAFLTKELACDDGEAYEPESLEHWEEARRRASAVMSQVWGICRALHHYGPR
jgi:hypothetical protein